VSSSTATDTALFHSPTISLRWPAITLAWQTIVRRTAVFACSERPSLAHDFFFPPTLPSDFYALPTNVSTIVDLLGDIGWATYQENMPYSGFSADYRQPNYLDPSSSKPYTYYVVRVHRPNVWTPPPRSSCWSRLNSENTTHSSLPIRSYRYQKG
jgi:hypothetical protein